MIILTKFVEINIKKKFIWIFEQILVRRQKKSSKSIKYRDPSLEVLSENQKIRYVYESSDDYDDYDNADLINNNHKNTKIGNYNKNYVNHEDEDVN